MASGFTAATTWLLAAAVIRRGVGGGGDFGRHGVIERRSGVRFSGGCSSEPAGSIERKRVHYQVEKVENGGMDG